MNQHELEKLIARYFDGETSLAEERRLRMLLARPEATGEAADRSDARPAPLHGGQRPQ